MTLTQILLDYTPIDNISIARGSILPANQTIPFTCYVDWEGHVKPFVQVLTREEFEGDFRSDAVGTVILQATQVDFDESNTNQVNVTLFNSGDSATYVNITTLSFEHGNITDTFSGNLTTPSLPLA